MRIPKVALLGGVSLFLCVAATTGQSDKRQTDERKLKIERESLSRQQAAPAASLRPVGALGGGDTCGTAVPITTLPFNDTGDTTGATNDVSQVGTGSGCGSITISAGQVNGPDLIYSFTVGAGNNLTVTVTPGSGYDVAIYVLSTCGNGTTCQAGADLNGDGGVETLNLVGLAPGTYYLYIDSFFTTAPDRQGPYTLNVSGTFGAVSTPTRTNTPTNTVTNTPTSTGTVSPSATPTRSPTPTLTTTGTTTSTPTQTGGGPGGATNIPTLSPMMLALYALALVLLSLFLVRRNS